MPWHGDRKWWGLYLLAPLAAALLYADGRIRVNLKMHEVLTIAIIVVLFGLTIVWTETHAHLMESEGIDAWAPADLHQVTGTFIAGSTVLVIPVGRPRPAARSLPAAPELDLHQADFLPANVQEEEQIWQISRN